MSNHWKITLCQGLLAEMDEKNSCYHYMVVKKVKMQKDFNSQKLRSRMKEGMKGGLHPRYACLVLLVSSLAGKGNLGEPALPFQKGGEGGNQGSGDQYSAAQ